MLAFILSRSQGINFHLKVIWDTRKFPRFVLNLVFLYTWDGVLGESLELSKVLQPLVLFDGQCGMVLEPMPGKLVSHQFDLGYTELFRVAAVTSRSLLTCDRDLRASLEFHHGSQGSFHV